MILVDGIHKISDILDKVVEILIVIMLGTMVIVTGAQIICRVFFTSLSWSEELTRYLLIWSSLFGAGCVYKHSGHIAITILMDHVPANAKQVLQIVVHLLCMTAFAIVVIYGYKYFGKQGNQLSPTLRWPMRYIYLCIPIGCGIMFIHGLDAILQNIKALVRGEA